MRWDSARDGGCIDTSMPESIQTEHQPPRPAPPHPTRPIETRSEPSPTHHRANPVSQSKINRLIDKGVSAGRQQQAGAEHSNSSPFPSARSTPRSLARRSSRKLVRCPAARPTQPPRLLPQSQSIPNNHAQPLRSGSTREEKNCQNCKKSTGRHMPYISSSSRVFAQQQPFFFVFCASSAQERGVSFDRESERRRPTDLHSTGAAYLS